MGCIVTVVIVVVMLAVLVLCNEHELTQLTANVTLL